MPNLALSKNGGQWATRPRIAHGWLSLLKEACFNTYL